MKIDVYSHVCPKPFIDYFSTHVTNIESLLRLDNSSSVRALWDIDKRLEMMARYEDYVQILVPTQPAAETFCGPDDSPKLARVYNDAMAEIVSKYPRQFPGAVAYLPLNNIDATLKEIERTVDGLGFKGILLDTPLYELKVPGEPAHGYNYETMKPIDRPEFWPIYETMSSRNLPIWIHPKGERGVPVYSGEEEDRYGLAFALGWPIESAMAMGRLVCSRVLAKYPNLKFIVHHCGSGIIPVLAGRIDYAFDPLRKWGTSQAKAGKGNPFEVKPATDYFRMFYADTALCGDVAGLECGFHFFGVEHILFGTDTPYGLEGGEKFIRKTIEAVHRMSISDADRDRIFSGNAKRILHLDI